MKTALKWYLITGGVLLAILVFMNFITPAISETSLMLGVAEKWFGRLYSAGSIVAAAVGLKMFSIVKRMTPMPVVKRIAEERTKNPAGGGFFGAGTTIWFCPACGMFNTPTHKFCWECGQALSFEDALMSGETDRKNNTRSDFSDLRRQLKDSDVRYVTENELFDIQNDPAFVSIGRYFALDIMVDREVGILKGSIVALKPEAAREENKGADAND